MHQLLKHKTVGGSETHSAEDTMDEGPACEPLHGLADLDCPPVLRMGVDDNSSTD
jgi:hypothetical protein